MTSAGKPRFRALEPAETEAVLERNHVGRIAFAKGNQAEIVPVHYVYRNGWIYGRTTPGGTIQQAGQHWWPVTFQVDEVRALFDWRSVIVKGGLYMVPAEGANWEQEAWAEGLELLRELVPQTLLEDDPVPERTTIFRIAVQEASGREALPE